MGINSCFSGPIYFEMGLMIFLLCLCSIMWAAQPEVLAITKIGVKKSLRLIELLRSDTALIISTGCVEVKVGIYLLLIYHSVLNIS